VRVWGIDSGIRHAVTGQSYTSVRVGAFMGYRILAGLAGLPVVPQGARVHVEDARWRGHLANLTPGEWQQHYAERIPQTLRGDAFLEAYGGTTDRVTRVAPDVTYPVRAATAHPVYENFRVRTFRALLRQAEPACLELAGELMYQSHASYSACGLGCERTDQLVQLVRDAGYPRGLYGAKITGGGSGGTVAILGRADAEDAVREIADAYHRACGHRPHVFSGSSPGAGAFGHLRLPRR
jgi:L-arabinokinase